MTQEFKTRRRDPNAVVGFVNFPTETISNTGEGGVFVRLVVVDEKMRKEYMERWVPCCGGYHNFYLDEVFLGDDQGRRGTKHYFSDDDRLLSDSFLAVMTLGATGWSSGEWVCQFDDLTEEGKALYRQMEALYQGCEVRLLTFLDT